MTLGVRALSIASPEEPVREAVVTRPVVTYVPGPRIRSLDPGSAPTTRVLPDRRKHRGPHPKDVELFSAERLPALRAAVSELSWLLSRGYAMDSSLKLVGDRYQLVRRQRIAVRRTAASDDAVERRAERRLELGSVGGTLVIDGFNLIITIEAGLAGAVLLKGRDGAIRDLSSMHGSYRRVEETRDAIRLIAAVLEETSDLSVRWMLDRPVSNSGRLATMLDTIAYEQGYRWEVELVHDADSKLIDTGHPVVTSDSHVMDCAPHWVNLADRVAARLTPDPWIIDLQTMSI